MRTVNLYVLCGAGLFLIGLGIGLLLVRRDRIRRDVLITGRFASYEAAHILKIPELARMEEVDEGQFEDCFIRIAAVRDLGPRPSDRAELVDILNTPCSGKINHAWVIQQVKQLADQYASELLEQAREGSLESFLKLRAFVGHPHHSSKYLAQTGAMYIIPPDWDQLMVKAIENPCLDDFMVTRKSLPDGKFSLVAADAARDRDLFHGKLVLALCNLPTWRHRDGKRSYRKEIGDVLYAAVVNMVADENARLNLTTAINTTK